MKHKYVLLSLILCYDFTMLNSAEEEEEEELSFHSVTSTPRPSVSFLENKRTASQQSYWPYEKETTETPKAVVEKKSYFQSFKEKATAGLNRLRGNKPTELPISIEPEPTATTQTADENEEPAQEPAQEPTWLDKAKAMKDAVTKKVSDTYNQLRGTSTAQDATTESEPIILLDGDIQLGDEALQGYRELHAQLKKLDSFILSRTITPLIEKYFPITAYRKLLEDIINNKRIPVDIDARIESLVTNLHTTAQPDAGTGEQTEEQQQETDRENKTTMKQVIGGHLLSYVNSQSEFIKKLNLATLPERAGQAQKDIKQVLSILTETKNPEEILLRIHKASLESFKDVMINDRSLQEHVSSLLTKIDNARKQGIAAGDTVLQITNLYKTYLHIILALGVANLVCCVVSVVSDVDSDNYKLSKRILEYLAVIDAISLTIGIGIKAVIADKFHGAFEKSVDALRQNDATMSAKRQPKKPQEETDETDAERTTEAKEAAKNVG
ncbi:hypothetical protein KBD08_02275 [Candidatus Babeliales bacterium]|nr:hypothetical protein [Candidatus Babeliales bacterium]